MESDPRGRLEDILQSAKLGNGYVEGMTFSDFCHDIEKQDAVIRRIEIVGEASSHLPPEIMEELSHVPWRKIRGMRNVVAHDYGNIDLNIVWNVATEHLANVAHTVERFLNTKSGQ